MHNSFMHPVNGVRVSMAVMALILAASGVFVAAGQNPPPALSKGR